MTTTNVLPDDAHGFIENLDETVYHRHPTSLSVSGAKKLLRAPALFQWEREHPVHKDVFDFGSAAHAIVLGTGPTIRVIQSDSWRTNAAKAEKAVAHEAGEIPLLVEDYQRVQDMADVLSTHTLAMELLSDGEPEVSAFCVDEPTGVLRRGRFDWLAKTILSDYKTSVCSAPAVFKRSAVAQFSYHMQAAWYLDLARDLGHPAKAFAFIVQEKSAPYLVSVIDLDDPAMDRGRELNDRALRIFRDCTAAGVWPGYIQPDHHSTVSLPDWAFHDDEETA